MSGIRDSTVSKTEISLLELTVQWGQTVVEQGIKSVQSTVHGNKVQTNT